MTPEEESNQADMPEKEYLPKDIIIRIKVLRRRLKLSQQQFADLTNVPVALFKQWENGSIQPPDSYWQRILLSETEEAQLFSHNGIIPVQIHEAGADYVTHANHTDSEEPFSTNEPSGGGETIQINYCTEQIPPTPTPIPPVLVVSSNLLTFNATQGLNNPSSQNLTLTNTGSTSITWKVIGDGAPWLSVNPQNGNLSSFQSQKITVAVSSVSLVAGNYSSIIDVFSTHNELGIINITLTVLPPPLTSVLVWKATTGSTVLTYTGHKDLVNALVWSPDGTRIASGSRDTTVQIWDAMHGNHVTIYRGHSDSVLDVALSPDGKHIASASTDNTVRVWGVANRENVYIFYLGHNVAVNAVGWSPDGTRIAFGGADHSVQVWSVSDGSHIFTYLGHSDGVNSIAWSPHDGKYIASASSDTTVQVWNASTGKRIITYRGHVNSVNTVAWSPDGTRIASAGLDATVQVWKAI